MNDGIDISIEIVLPDSPDLHLQIGDHIASFVERARAAGSTVALHPTPDETDDELAEVRSEIDKLAPDQRSIFDAQIARIEALIRFGRRADGLLSKP